MTQLPGNLSDLLAARSTDARLKRAITDRWEITREPYHRVRTVEVYAVIAQAVNGRSYDRAVFELAQRLVLELGGVYVRRKNARFFSGLRPLAGELIPGQGRTAMQMQRAWNERLRVEGLGDEPREQPKAKAYRAEINLATLERMRADYWRQRERLDIWGLYAVEGLGEDTIAAQVGMHKSSVHRIVAAEKARMWARLNRRAGDRGSDHGGETVEDNDADS